MNENIDLTKILKNCPEGWEFYSSNAGYAKFVALDSENSNYPIILRIEGKRDFSYTKEGWFWKDYPDGECTLFPSKEQRDWSKFTAPWYKKEKFDPNTFQPFDRVLTRHSEDERWDINFYSYKKLNCSYPYICIDGAYKYCIPYNDDTKHLIGITDEAPEYYKHWED